jgi:glucosamine kinase
MSKDIFIGIDGGGSKTKVLVADASFNIIGEGLGGPANIRLSVETSWNSIYEAIGNALKQTGIELSDSSYSFHIGMGLAGISVPKAKEAFLATPHPFRTLILECDAHIACLSAHDGKDGAIIVTGTGVIGYLIENSKCFRVGGWGFPHSDTGGGAWLGMEAVRLTFKAIDGAIEKSALLGDVFAKFNKNLPDFVAWANSARSTDFATLAPMVTKAAIKRDLYGVSLLKQAAEEIATVHDSLMNKSNTQKLKCYLLGGLAKHIHSYLRNKEDMQLADIKKTPDMGAIYMLKARLCR